MLTPQSKLILRQNTTFGGIQGFTRRPSTAWHDDSGKLAGIDHQERNWTYVLVEDAGHLVPLFKPASVRFLSQLERTVLISEHEGIRFATRIYTGYKHNRLGHEFERECISSGRRELDSSC
jgi:hypothetical protein